MTTTHDAGTTWPSGPHIRRELAIDTADGKEAYAVRRAVAFWTKLYQRVGAGATVTETTGYWDGASSTGLCIRFDWPEGHEGYFLWRGRGFSWLFYGRNEK